MIDPEVETLITASEAARRPEFHVNGKAAHITTVWRRILNGDLESLKIAGKRVTSVEAIKRMIAKQNNVAPVALSSSQRRRQIDAAGHRLAAAGI